MLCQLALDGGRQRRAAVAGRAGNRGHDGRHGACRGRCCPSSGRAVPGRCGRWAVAGGCAAFTAPLGGVGGYGLRADARRLRAHWRRAWLLWLGSQATKELAALPAIDCATCGVIAAHGSLAALADDDLLAGDAVDALAGRIGHIPDVGHLGGGLVLGGDDVAAQRVVGALVLAGRHGDALLLHRAREFLLDLLGDRIRRADDRRHRRPWPAAAVAAGVGGSRGSLRRSRAVPAEQRGARLTAGQARPRQRHEDGERHPWVPALRRSSVHGRHSDVPLLQSIPLITGCRRTNPAAGDSTAGTPADSLLADTLGVQFRDRGKPQRMPRCTRLRTPQSCGKPTLSQDDGGDLAAVVGFFCAPATADS